MVLSGWPRMSEVFALNELLALHRAGMLAAVFATKPGESGPRQPDAAELDPVVEVLPDRDVEGQAAVVAHRLAGSGVTAVHGYFAHRPAAVAAAAAERLGVRFGFSAHALDVRRAGGAELARLAGRAAVVVCCNPDAAGDLRRAGVVPEVVRHGVDLERFAVVGDRRDADRPLLLAVGRFVAKKGFDVLVEAMTMVPPSARLRIVGDGPLRGELTADVLARGLGHRVELAARCTHDRLRDHYAAADVVVVPSVVDRQGDRDGLPNVVLEAMACGLPVVASDVAAIGTAVTDGVTGRLVPPGDPSALASALTGLIDDPPRRRSQGRAGRCVAESDFDLDRRTAELCRLLERRYA